MCVDASLSFAALFYIFLFAQTNVAFSIAVLSMVVAFNGYACYCYRQIEQKHSDIQLNENWIQRWTRARFLICSFEWLLYFAYLFFIGPSAVLEHWILFVFGFIPITFVYYELEKIEHEIGIYSLAVETSRKTNSVLGKTIIV